MLSSLTMVFKSRHGLIFLPTYGGAWSRAVQVVERRGGEEVDRGEKRGRVSLSEGIPLHSSHSNKEEGRVCVLFMSLVNILDLHRDHKTCMFPIKPLNFCS